MSNESRMSDFEREVADRFGLVPNFFASAPDAPNIVERLWYFAKSEYVDSPIPALFKERLFVYLSRFCQVRYCILRHAAFLLGYGHAGGDPSAPAQTIAQAIRLLRAAPPWERDIDAALKTVEADPRLTDWPAPESEIEDRLFSAATLVFVEPARSDRPRRALRHALGGERFERLMGLLAFIRTAHYWTKVHPDLACEPDVLELLRSNEELARLLLEDREAARCDMGVGQFAELQELRELHERHELEKTRHALELQLAQKEILLKEVNHRVKNILQIASSVLHLQMAHVRNAEAIDSMRGAVARIRAFAAVHERLYARDDIKVISFDEFLADLAGNIGEALGRDGVVEIDVGSVMVPTDMAIPLALMMNELIADALKCGGPPCRVTMQSEPGAVSLRVSDAGRGPDDSSRAGVGSKIVEAVGSQLGARIATRRGEHDYTVEIAIPLPSQP
jgi:two-component sensor histidine kinase